MIVCHAVPVLSLTFWSGNVMGGVNIYLIIKYTRSRISGKLIPDDGVLR